MSDNGWDGGATPPNRDFNLEPSDDNRINHDGSLPPWLDVDDDGFEDAPARSDEYYFDDGRELSAELRELQDTITPYGFGLNEVLGNDELTFLTTTQASADGYEIRGTVYYSASDAFRAAADTSVIAFFKVFIDDDGDYRLGISY